MKRPPHGGEASTETLRMVALRYPEAEEGVACEGTAAEKRTLKARGKAFLFLGATGAMLKLRDSLAEAAGLAAAEPDRYRVGAHGWVTITFGDTESPAVELLVRWVDESYRLLVPKQLLTLLPQSGGPPSGATEPAKAKVPRSGRSPTAARADGPGRVGWFGDCRELRGNTAERHSSPAGRAVTALRVSRPPEARPAGEL